MIKIRKTDLKLLETRHVKNEEAKASIKKIAVDISESLDKLSLLKKQVHLLTRTSRKNHLILLKHSRKTQSSSTTQLSVLNEAEKQQKQLIPLYQKLDRIKNMKELKQKQRDISANDLQSIENAFQIKADRISAILFTRKKIENVYQKVSYKKKKLESHVKSLNSIKERFKHHIKREISDFKGYYQDLQQEQIKQKEVLKDQTNSKSALDQEVSQLQHQLRPSIHKQQESLNETQKPPKKKIRRIYYSQNHSRRNSIGSQTDVLSQISEDFVHENSPEYSSHLSSVFKSPSFHSSSQFQSLSYVQ